MDRSRLAHSVVVAAGFALVAAAAGVYALFLHIGRGLYGGGSQFYLPPLGVALFAAGFYLGPSRVKRLSSMTPFAWFLVAATAMMWVFAASGWATLLYESQVGSAMASATTDISAWLLSAFGLKVFWYGTLITLTGPAGRVVLDVTNACGGASSSIVFTAAFLLMVADVGRRRRLGGRQVGILFALGGATIFLMNVVRVSILGAVAYYLGLGPMDALHQYLGYFLFVAAVSYFWWFSLGKLTAQHPRVAAGAKS